MAPPLPDRKKLRCLGHDYTSGGAYFVTFCCTVRGNVLGECNGMSVVLNAIGQFVDRVVCCLRDAIPAASLDAHVVMPDHVHAIVWIDGLAATRPSMSQVVGSTKSMITRGLPSVLAAHPHLAPTTPVPLFQRSFHDRVIRQERELEALRHYIDQNPLRWRL